MQNGRFEKTIVGEEMHDLIRELYPLPRSMTGQGVRDTLHALSRVVPVDIRETPTGAEIFDWTVPPEWSIRDAFIKDREGNRLVDFTQSNLHVVGHSEPIHDILSWRALKTHVYSLPDHPDWIPYRVSYHQKNWGICVTHRQYEQFEAAGDEAQYEVEIDADLFDGSLTHGEVELPGDTDDEILISTHVCHPSLCNDNLSGIAVSTFLARHLANRPRRHTFRFIYVPATIGSIAWLALNEANLHRIRHGLILANVGDSGNSTYKRSRRGNAIVDRAVEHVLATSGEAYEVRDFEPVGYDERQFCSPGINLPIGCLMRTPNDEYPEYHTSADDLDLVTPEALADSLAKVVATIEILETNSVWRNEYPMCEPQLGRRGLFKQLSGDKNKDQSQRALYWVLNYSDGRHSLLDIAEKSGMPFPALARAADILAEHRLISEMSREQQPANLST
jgi:aminopeptidase-like protein